MPFLNFVKMMKTDNEIFRHFRPVYYDKSKHVILPETCGGVSFLLSPIEQSKYEYWVYICPLKISFSSKQAISTLRKVKEDIDPWGSIIMDGRKIIDLLLEDCRFREFLFPTSINNLIEDISDSALRAQTLFESRVNQVRDASKYYK